MPCYVTYYTAAYGNGCEGLYLPMAFRYSHLHTRHSHLNTRYSHLDTRYSQLQLPVVVLKRLYNLSNHLAMGYNWNKRMLISVCVWKEMNQSEMIRCVIGVRTTRDKNTVDIKIA